MNKYKDLNIDLANISLVILADQLNTDSILTVDTKYFIRVGMPLTIIVGFGFTIMFAILHEV